MKSVISYVENISKKSFVRVIMVVIPVAISAIYTNVRNREYEIENKMLADRALSLEKNVSNLKSNMLILSLADDNFPMPKWIKSVDLMMLKLNKAYEDVYLKPYGLKRSDYIGEYDYDIWPDEVASSFRDADRLVLQAGKPLTFYEEMRMDTLQPLVKAKVTKYPIKVSGTIVGVGGYIELETEQADEN